MILSTTNSIPGREISEITGIVRGSTVRARHVGRDFVAALKNIVGGEIEEYTQFQADAREQAIQRMIKDAGNFYFSGIEVIECNGFLKKYF
ncbi:MAG: heavy metal-binding domain-containing protein [Bacteroidales bacterium]